MISVIIPTRNRVAFLSATLRSIETQTLPKEEFEVLVVDNGSTDSTRETVEEFRLRNSNIRYLYAPEPGLHVGRHLGLLESKGEILSFLDDDVEVGEKWLDAVKETFNDKDVVLAGGNCHPKFTSEPPAWLLCMWNETIEGQQLLPELSILSSTRSKSVINPYYIWGCNFNARRKLVLLSGGFHPDGFPAHMLKYRGDGESHISTYVLENNLVSVFNPLLSVKHMVTPERMTKIYFAQRAFKEGVTTSYILHRKFLNKSVIQLYVQIARCLLNYSKNIISCMITKRVKDFRSVHVTKNWQLICGLLAHWWWVQTDKNLKAWILKENYLP